MLQKHTTTIRAMTTARWNAQSWSLQQHAEYVMEYKTACKSLSRIKLVQLSTDPPNVAFRFK